MESIVKVSRQVIKARDIQNFFGKQERQSFKMMAEMRVHFNKDKHQPITVNEFCTYYKVDPKDVHSAMKETEEFKLEIAYNRKKKSTAINPTPSTNLVHEINLTEKHIPYKFSPRIL